MVSVDARAVELDDVTLVTGTLEGGSVPTRVTLRNRLDGPVWPPRRMGMPVEGWDETGYVDVVPAGERIAIGYACPAPAVDPPLTVLTRERAGKPDGDFDSATAVLRGLGSPAPPREALALPAGDASDGHTAQKPPTTPSGTVGRSAGHRSAEEVAGSGAESHPSDDHVGASAPDVGVGASGPFGDPGPTVDADVPDVVAAWLDRVEARLEETEPLADATDVSSATEALQSAGSLGDVEAFEEGRQADADRLRAVTKRANALAYRAERAAIPVDIFDRLA